MRREGIVTKPGLRSRVRDRNDGGEGMRRHTRKDQERESSILRTLIYNLPDGIFLKDRNSRFIFANKTIAEMMQAPDPKALLGKTDHDFYPKEVADTLLAEEQGLIETGGKIVNKEESKQLSSRSRRILTSKVAIVGEDGQVTGLVGITRDVTERYEAQEKPRASEERYRSLLDQAADGIYLLDQEGAFLLANPETCEMLGYSIEELLRLNIVDTYPEQIREDGKHRLDAVAAGEKLCFEREVRRKDGNRFFAEFSARRLEDGTLQGIMHDITGRKRRESELSFERTLLGALLETVPDRIYFKDLESRFMRISRSKAHSMGLKDASEAIGKSDGDFYPEELARKARHDEQRIIRTGEPLVDGEEEVRPGEWRQVNKLPLHDAAGITIGTLGISRDITEQKRARERMESLARFPDEDPYPVMRVTPDAKLIYGNRASGEITTWWGEPETEGIIEQYRRALARTWESGEKKEIDLQTAGRTFAVTMVPIRAAGYINLYARDVTEERALAERLNQAQKMEAIGLLTGGVAHDFNNILQAITGYSELLKSRVSAENQKYTEEVINAAKRAASLTTQLLAFSRKQVLRPRVVDTKELVDSMQKMLRRIIGEDVELRTMISPDTGNFVGDAGQVEQVLLNLVVNARDAMPAGGVLTIETSNRVFDEAYVADHPGAAAGQFVRLAVSDTGVGMDEKTLRRIYDPFFTTKEMGKGTGLGLSVAYGIVKQSEGYINCYSEVGKGTTFTVYLPMTADEAEALRIMKPVATAPHGTERLLLVDDDPGSRGVTRIALEEAGYVVIEAAGGKDALAAVCAPGITVDLLITDIVMPHMSGKELAQSLKQIFSSLRVLYISGYTADVISHHGILEGDVDFMEKPFSSFDLLRKVRDMLDRK